MATSLIIVDDFLANAAQLRDAALKLSYPKNLGAFPGRNSRERITIPGLTEEVSRLVGESLRPIDPLESHAKCRVTLASDAGRAKVHIDESHWSGILYLSAPEHCLGGTDFFRHRRTVTDQAPLTVEDALAHGYSSQEEMVHAVLSADSSKDDAWECTMSVPMRFNRLVLLRPWLWHTAGPGFGDSLASGRLVYLLFYRSI